MFYVYALMGDDSKLYIGYSKNLKRRLKEHLNKKVYTTRRIKNPKLIYYETYESKILAQEREGKLKQFGSAHHELIKRLGIT